MLICMAKNNSEASSVKLPSFDTARVCEFDKLRDVCEVEQGLAVDITDALRTGVVRDVNSNLDYNGIDDPGRIIGRVSDRFDAIEASRVIKKYRRASVPDVPVSGAAEAPASAGGSAPSGDA